ncbi:MAG: adenine deaminase [Proteobacteria bacterium]|nr:adenine deaminase [Pseudomonadota bacterium]
MDTSPELLARRIGAGTGRERADLVIRGTRFLDVATGELDSGDIAVAGEAIVGTGEEYRGETEIDGRDLVVVPGFVDAHVHVESSLVAPAEFDRSVLPRGTTAAVCDPHEICNVCGAEGLRYVLDQAAGLAMDLFVQLPSCVPATGLETAGAELAADDLIPFRDHPSAIGLAEMMNFPGVLARDPAVLAKLAAFAGRHVDGHAPLVRGYDLNGYLAAGIRTDHESTSCEEAREKLAKGMHVFIREGSASKDARALAPLLGGRTWPFLALCTDDRNPLDVAEEGHIDFAIRAVIAAGAPPAAAYSAASYGAAHAFGLRDRGRVAPGYRADLVLLADVERCAVAQVIKDGRVVTPGTFAAVPRVAPVALRSVRLEPVSAAAFAVPAPGPGGPVIGLVPERILTKHLTLALPYREGCRHPDPGRDVQKVCVFHRHGRNRNVGRGFVKGFGLKAGALASSVGHDSHNLTVVGVDDADMALAVNRLIELQGGFVAAAGGRVRAELALPIAGLMSTAPAEEVAARLKPLRAAARAMGCPLKEPFLQLSFLPLPVIPHLKITDRGLVDVDRFELIAA